MEMKMIKAGWFLLLALAFCRLDVLAQKDGDDIGLYEQGANKAGHC